MRTTIFDASSVLAFFFDAPGAEKVEQSLQQATEADKPILIGTASWTEVLSYMYREKGAEGLEVAQSFERTMPLKVESIEPEIAESAAMLKTKHGLSLAGAFSAALAWQRKAELVTGDEQFAAVEGKIKIAWLK
jgi:PIN domain nuclease of toxin-antitoxin system